MIKLRPDRAALVRWGYRDGLILRGGDLGYTLHAALAAAFGDRAPQPFRLVEQPGDAVLYGYAGEPADALVTYARAIADPEPMHALGVDGAVSKEMPADWRPGDRFGFEVRVRPVIRQDRPGDRKHSRERDAFQAVAETVSPNAGETAMAGAMPTRRDVYADWLAARLDGACRLVDRPRLVEFQRTRVARRGSDRVLRESEGPDAVVDGVLEIGDPDAFGRLLAFGVGRHRAFGFGMLLLKPPGRR